MNLGKLWQAGVAHNRIQAPVNSKTDGGDDGGGGADNSAETDTSTDTVTNDNSEADKTASKPDESLLQEVMKKKEKIKTLSDQNQELQSQLEELNSKFKDVNLDEFKALKQQIQEQREKELEGKGNWQELKADLEERFNSEKQQIIAQRESDMQRALSEKEESFTAIQQKLLKQEQIIEELTIGSKFSNSKFVSEELIPSATKIRKLYGEHFDAVEGEIHAFDKPRGVEKRNRLVDADGKPLSFELALSKIVESDPDVDTIKRAKIAPGSNSNSDNRNGQQPSQSVGSGINRIQAALNRS